eukprot:TRINITY_DN3707_c0_g1_i1.p1 TRINITY_DN3707_c0_g1~~TRINITY_DN3707_c0_g1_i1.p1  ORF type:complete len:568 (-),score=94.40 TRINITY_DN3707_c0_g1_i1:1145-2848(-)
MGTLQEWNDFPKGLRIIILDEDSQAVAQIKAKLESFHYTVSAFEKEADALDTIAEAEEAFHVALVDASTGSGEGGFKFLQAARDLPVVMMSSETCLSTMMKCIALGAVDFLQKPLAEDKLRNIWQHVVHKAFRSCDGSMSDSLKPLRATIMSMLQLNADKKGIQTERTASEEQNHSDTASDVQLCVSKACKLITKETNELTSAPSTPQLVRQAKSPSVKGPMADAANTSAERREGDVKLEAEATSAGSPEPNGTTSLEKDFENNNERMSSDLGHLRQQSVDITGEYLQNAISCSSNSLLHLEEEVSSAQGLKTDEEQNLGKDNVFSSDLCNEDNVDSGTEAIKTKKSSNSNHAQKKSNSSGAGKKKIKVEWTSDLHRRFVQAVEQLGVDQAIPSRILEVMKVDGLTRHNIASHLQKYRAHIRHKKFREDEVARGRCWQRFDAKWTVSAEGGYQKPHFPTVGAPAPLHVWGSPTTHHSATQMWQHFPVGTPLTWAAQSSPFGNHPTGSSEAWGCPPSYGTTYYTNGVLVRATDRHPTISVSNNYSVICIILLIVPNSVVLPQNTRTSL